MTSNFSLLIGADQASPILDRQSSPDAPGSDPFERVASRIAFFGWGGDARDVPLDPQTALTYSAVWGCVRVISQALASVAWHEYERSADGKSRREIDDDDIAWLLGLQASSELSAFAWREVMLKDALTWGNAYSEIERDGFGRVRWLHRISPQRVRPNRDSAGRLIYPVAAPDGAYVETVLSAESVFHVRGMGEDGIVGYSPIDMARRSIKLGQAEERFGQSFFEKGPMPGGVLTLPGNLNSVQRRQYRADFEEAYGGTRNAGRVMVLSGGATFNPFDLPNDDAQFLQSRRFQIEDIARWYGVPPHKLADLERATFCLPAGQTVLTEDGPRPIEQVKPGEMVWSRSEEGLRLAPVLRSGPTGESAILTIRTTNRTLRCNAKHPVLCRRKTHVPRVAQSVGGVVAEWGVCDVVWETQFVPAGELMVGDTIVTLERLPDGGSLEACPTRLPTIGFMEFCGLLLGDGNLIRSGTSAYVTIARAASASYMDYYREVMRTEFDSGEREWPSGEAHNMARLTAAQVQEVRELGKRVASVSELARRHGVNINAASRIARGLPYSAGHPQAIGGEALERFRAALAERLAVKEIASRYEVSTSTVQKILSGKLWAGAVLQAAQPIRLQEGARQTRFSSAHAVEELQALGLSGTARTKRVPGWVFHLPQSHRLAFLRGFLDADGSCDKKGRLSFSSCNGTLLGQVRDLAMGCGVPVTNSRLQRGMTTLPNGARKAFAQYSFTCSDPGANRRIGSRTPLYVARLEAGQPFSRKERAYPWHGGRGFAEEGLSLSRINSISIGPAEPVYDLTVEGTHSFIAEGVIVHNSNVEEQEISFVRDCLFPWARRLEIEADIKLFGRTNRGRLYTRLNLDALMRGNSATQTETVTSKVVSGILTPNEGREYFDLNPLPDGDQLMVQGAMVPLERAINPPAPPPPAAPGPPPSSNGTSGEPATNRLALIRRLLGYDPDQERDEQGRFAGDGGGDSGGSGADKVQEARDKEDEDAQEKRDQEEQDLGEARDNEDEQIQEKRDEEEEQVQDARVEEDKETEENRGGEDADIQESREQEDAEHQEAKDAIEQAVSERQEARDNEDADTQDARDTEDADAGNAQDKEDADIQEAREKEDEDIQAARDKADEEASAQYEAQQEERLAARDKADEEQLTQREAQDKVTAEQDAAQDKAVVEAREKEDKATQAAREKEDDETQEKRDKEDEAIDERHDRDEITGEERLAQHEANSQARGKEDAATQKVRDAQDGKTEAARDKEDAATEKARDARDAKIEAGRLKEDSQDNRQREREDEQASKQYDREGEKVDAARPKEDAAREKSRDREDTRTQKDRDARDAKTEAARDKEDAVKEAAREKEDAATEKELDQLDTAESKRETAREKEDKVLSSAREKEDAATEKARVAEDRARAAKEKEEDRALEQKRKEEDRATAARHKEEDRQLEEKRSKEDAGTQKA